MASESLPEEDVYVSGLDERIGVVRVRCAQPFLSVQAVRDGEKVTYIRNFSHGMFLSGTVIDILKDMGEERVLICLDQVSRDYIRASRPDVVEGLNEDELKTCFDRWGVFNPGNHLLPKQPITGYSWSALKTLDKKDFGPFWYERKEEKVPLIASVVAAAFAGAAAMAVVLNAVKEKRQERREERALKKG